MANFIYHNCLYITVSIEFFKYDFSKVIFHCQENPKSILLKSARYKEIVFAKCISTYNYLYICFSSVRIFNKFHMAFWTFGHI